MTWVLAGALAVVGLGLIGQAEQDAHLWTGAVAVLGAAALVVVAVLA